MQKTNEEKYFEKIIVLEKGLKHYKTENGILQSEIEELKHLLKEEKGRIVGQDKFFNQSLEIKKLSKKIEILKQPSKVKTHEEKYREEIKRLRDELSIFRRKYDRLLLDTLKNT